PLDGTTSSSPSGFNPVTHAWNFGDATTGSGAAPNHTYATAGTYRVTLIVTDSHGTQSAPATTTATFGNFPPTVAITAARENQFGDPFTLPVSFSDPGTDGPWAYSVTWGMAPPRRPGASPRSHRSASATPTP